MLCSGYYIWAPEPGAPKDVVGYQASLADVTSTVNRSLSVGLNSQNYLLSSMKGWLGCATWAARIGLWGTKGLGCGAPKVLCAKQLWRQLQAVTGHRGWPPTMPDP